MARGGEIDEALREVAVVGGQRRGDLALGHRGVEFLVERARGDARRIVGDRDRVLRARNA